MCILCKRWFVSSIHSLDEDCYFDVSRCCRFRMWLNKHPSFSSARSDVSQPRTAIKWLQIGNPNDDSVDRFQEIEVLTNELESASTFHRKSKRQRVAIIMPFIQKHIERVKDNLHKWETFFPCKLDRKKTTLTGTKIDFILYSNKAMDKEVIDSFRAILVIMSHFLLTCDSKKVVHLNA